MSVIFMRRYSFLFAALMMRFSGAKLQNLFDFSHFLLRKLMDRRRMERRFLTADFKFLTADNF